MQRPFYCKSWFRAKKRPTELWDENRAREAHLSGSLYGVLIGSAQAPFCFLEVTRGFVGVGFLDDGLRETLSYGFAEYSPGRLFLKQATYRAFVTDTDKVALGTTYVFEQAGQMKIQRSDFVQQTVSAFEAVTDVAANYAEWPRFGEYDALIKVERPSLPQSTPP